MDDVRMLPVGEDSEARISLDELGREGARRMIAAALEAEVDEYVASLTEEVGEDGKRLVVRNGRARERKLTVGSGTVPIRAPRVNDRRADEETGERKRFSSRILPAYARRSPKVTEVLSILSLHGLSTGDFGPALSDLLGEDASGLSPSSIQRLTDKLRSLAMTPRQLVRLVRYSIAMTFEQALHGGDLDTARAILHELAYLPDTGVRSASAHADAGRRSSSMRVARQPK